MPRQLLAGLFFALIGAIVAYLLAVEWIRFQLGSDIGYGYPLLNLASILDNTQLTGQLAIGFGALMICGFLFGAHYATEPLTKVANSRWQTKADLRRNKLLREPGAGFVFAKTSKPKGSGRFLNSTAFPNILVIAPTGAGKGVGFVYPNLLTFEGSTITLDIKGENYDTTARWRFHEMGNKVYRFAPADFEGLSCRYNPLERIGALNDYDQVAYELRKIAGLFLQADGAGEWLNGAIQLFCAAGGVAYFNQTFTLGGIYDVLAEGDKDLRQHIGVLAKAATNKALRKELQTLAKLESKTLSSYLSVMNNAGFDLWGNRHIADMTSRSDFSLDDLRRQKISVYFAVNDSDLEPLAGLVRLFFNELVANIQSRLPGPDETHKVMIILDEFHRLGKMSRVAEAMTTIRGFNGMIAIITQTVPKLDKIYSYEERLSIQGGAGIKLYMTPSEEMTIEDLSKACGMTTRRTVTKSRQTGLDKLSTISERTEEKPLLPDDEARRLPEGTAIAIVNGRQPVRAYAIKHYEDRTFAPILEKQKALSWDALDRDQLVKRTVEIQRFQRNNTMAAAGPGGSNSMSAPSAETPPRPTSEDLAAAASAAREMSGVLKDAEAVADKPEQLMFSGMPAQEKPPVKVTHRKKTSLAVGNRVGAAAVSTPGELEPAS
ncbi:type IV secretory system conjugative DNA transfer family protein [Gymnodinialimonas sp. 2305UL16-5]|uniref:type IV secretory system conjugative DNA transfer family protein n=1 Tax=Gymnodinialimonas mytili TaxID=3126503 RepID=UPI0030B53AA2